MGRRRPGVTGQDLARGWPHPAVVAAWVPCLEGFATPLASLWVLCSRGRLYAACSIRHNQLLCNMLQQINRCRLIANGEGDPFAQQLAQQLRCKACLGEG